ncbi:serine/threonine-protein kinase [Catenulispora subtropica]|uniref:non-specific serine/threonine protein kinase n=1 Tax=Catenulispora subtropica TaxID=450798 RepID=A0ABN2RC62_9ACTN
MTAGDAGAYVIDGRFELMERLGGGGMGLVWRARDLMLQREVALKEVRSPDPAVYGSDPSEAGVVRERVLREAQALARLHHPNVVTIYHIVDAPELAHPWLVMELVTGGSLEGRLKRGTLTVPEAARIGRGVLAALRAAHAAGIQHRDVKPGNVLLRADGTPVLTDFGIAALEATPGLTATGMLIGSPEYMAPERIHGREGDPASDLWSLGIMLYLGLEGHNPLRRETTIATIAAVAEANVPPPVRSGALTPALSALLVKDPGLRPTAEQLDWMLAQAEQAELSGSGLSATPMPGPASMTGMPTPPPYPTGRPVDAGGATGWAPTAQTAQYETQDRTTGQTPVSSTGPVENPYGTGATPIKRRSYVTRYAVSAVFSLGMAGTIMYMSHTFSGGSPGAQGTASHGSDAPGAVKISIPSIAMPGGGDSSTGDGPTAAGATGATGTAPSSAPATAGKNLLTPASARALIAGATKASGSAKFVEVTLYDDGHAIFDIIKTDDPKAYDSWIYQDGTVKFWTQGSELRSDQKVFDATKINWDALPAMVKDGQATLKVKDPNLTYVIVNGESDDTPGSLEMDLHITNDYHSGYLHCDGTGKIVRRYPQE